MKMVKVYGLKNTSLNEVKAMIKLVNNELDKDETNRTCMSSPGAAFKIALEVLKVQEMAGKNFAMKHLQYLIQRGLILKKLLKEREKK